MSQETELKELRELKQRTRELYRAGRIKEGERKYNLLIEKGNRYNQKYPDKFDYIIR